MQTCQRTDVWADRHADVSTDRRMGQQTCRRVHGQTYGPTDMQTSMLIPINNLFL
ncbi:hypothetical protein DPMN_036034 [Dreissena polymorpha]|uniref:Uncharacterized protein n=1 Tax=Dreissena polymorpha TaxID=45954 RepID=A0A9D4MAT5_DREPO|nr:hypothetical protein DPMN_036034 [Dreissena polymorpha]